eukprot:scaffold2270_cov362-Prasinococcus_capsulatus_cf.AAC.8
MLIRMRLRRCGRRGGLPGGPVCGYCGRRPGTCPRTEPKLHAACGAAASIPRPKGRYSMREPPPAPRPADATATAAAPPPPPPCAAAAREEARKTRDGMRREENRGEGGGRDGPTWAPRRGPAAQRRPLQYRAHSAAQHSTARHSTQTNPHHSPPPPLAWQGWVGPRSAGEGRGAWVGGTIPGGAGVGAGVGWFVAARSDPALTPAVAEWSGWELGEGVVGCSQAGRALAAPRRCPPAAL